MRRDWRFTLGILTITAVVIMILFGLLDVLRRSSKPVSPEVSPNAVESDATTVEARVLRVIEVRQMLSGATGQLQPVQQLELEITRGAERGQRVIVDHGLESFVTEDRLYREGDHVLVMFVRRSDDSQTWIITDVIRTGALMVLGLAFVAAVVFVSGWKGIRALVGLAFSFLVIFGFVLPQILAGHEPVLVSILGAFVLLTVTLYLTQGWTLKTHAALVGVLFSLILIGVLATFSVGLARLTGLGSEEALFLQIADVSINARGLLLAGIIVGTLGVLDDVIVSQAATVIELADVDPTLSWRDLYRRALNIGRDHIAATINTLVLAYVGAAMPLMLLFQIYPEPWQYTINREIIAEEVVRTLVGTLGLIAAVPITTLATSLLQTIQSRRAQAE